jgi:hypothetical protein
MEDEISRFVDAVFKSKAKGKPTPIGFFTKATRHFRWEE